MSDTTEEIKLHKNEAIKTESNGLYGSLIDDLNDEEVGGFGKDGEQLIKFHGIYQQKKRDRKAEGPDISFMIRGRIPGGRVTGAQYLAWDQLADEFGNGSIRLTTRQSIQLHGILKGNLPKIVQALEKVNSTTAGACGDVVRNVTQPVNPQKLPHLSLLDAPAEELSEHFLFKSTSYAGVWIDGKELEQTKVDTIYGDSYLPRKFKIAITAVGDNSIDIHTNDLGFAATYSEDKQTIEGYHVFIGGGMGMNHNQAKTYPRLSDHAGWIPAEALIKTTEAAVSIHRDFGDRVNRRHARLKYVVEEKGLAFIQDELNQRSGFTLEQRELPSWETPSYHGWIEAEDGSWSLGMHTLSGRIADFSKQNVQLKEALRAIFTEHQQVQLIVTADQDIILTDITTAQKQDIENRLSQSGFNLQAPGSLRTRALACPALPTCSLATSESERVIDELLTGIDSELATLELSDRAPVLRMTGCPNGCARPYAAEIGIVGQGPKKYSIFLGGNPEGTKLSRPIFQKVMFDDIATLLGKVFNQWQQSEQKQQHLGAYIDAASNEDLQALVN